MGNSPFHYLLTRLHYLLQERRTQNHEEYTRDFLKVQKRRPHKAAQGRTRPHKAQQGQDVKRARLFRHRNSNRLQSSQLSRLNRSLNRLRLNWSMQNSLLRYNRIWKMTRVRASVTSLCKSVQLALNQACSTSQEILNLFLPLINVLHYFLERNRSENDQDDTLPRAARFFIV